MGTFFLVYCALLIDERSLFFSDPSAKQYYDAFVSPFLVGWLVTALIMSMAGPTGYAANPARDMGPRFAHWVLPIPNKGSSEWHYSWVPVAGPFLGGALAAFAFYATRFVFIGADAYPEWSLPAAQTPIFGSWSM